MGKQDIPLNERIIFALDVESPEAARQSILAEHLPGDKIITVGGYQVGYVGDLLYPLGFELQRQAFGKVARAVANRRRVEQADRVRHHLGVNKLLTRLVPRHAFSRGELLTIYVILVVASALSGHDQLQILYTTIVWVVPNATPENAWERDLWPHLNRAREFMETPSAVDAEKLDRLEQFLSSYVGIHPHANATVFARYWVEALQDAGADTDKNDMVSVLEAFRYADQTIAAHNL